jgi:TRAP-type C4-dicarboxylate transport system permease small subunit
MQEQLDHNSVQQTSNIESDKITQSLRIAPTGIERLTSKVVQLQCVFSEIVLVVLTVLIAAEVVCRSFFGFSLLIVEEIAGYLLLTLVFLGMGIATYENALFRVEFIINALPENIAEFLLIIYRLLCLAFTLILFQQMCLLVIDSYKKGVSAATILATPLFIPQLALVIGAATLSLILVAQIVNSLRLIKRNLR